MLILLFLAVPLTASALAVIFPALGRYLQLIVPAGLIPAAAYLYGYGTVAHSTGLYVGGVAIPFVADRFSAIMIATTAIVALGANWFAFQTTKQRFYPALTLMLIAGVNGALLTADLFNFFVFIELMLLPSYGLLAMQGGRDRLRAGRVFVLVNLSASTLLLAGVAFLYGQVGTANLAALAGAGEVAPIPLAIIVIALCAKAGTFPVHTWLPRTYPITSASVMGLFSGLHTKVAVYMLFRIWVVVFDMDARWNWLIITVCVASMLIGGFGGLGEHTLRRIIGYQMVNGMPFILIVFAFCTHDPQRALAAGIMYALHHMVTIGSLVLTSGAVEEAYGTDRLKKLSGLQEREPLTAFVFAAGAFSIVGFPPLSGIVGKVLVVFEAARAEQYFVIAIIIIASFGALLSMLRAYREAFWGAPMKNAPREARVGALIAPGAALIAVSFAMFFGAGFVFDWVQGAAASLLDVATYSEAVLGPDPIGVV